MPTWKSKLADHFRYSRPRYLRASSNRITPTDKRKLWAPSAVGCDHARPLVVSKIHISVYTNARIASAARYPVATVVHAPIRYSLGRFSDKDALSAVGSMSVKIGSNESDGVSRGPIPLLFLLPRRTAAACARL